MPSFSQDLVVVVVDDRALRRAAIAAWLAEWRRQSGISVQEVDARDPIELRRLPNCRLCVLSVGKSFGDARSRGILKMLRAAFPDRPLVVVADDDELEHIVLAFEQGASAYIPTDTDPATAMSVLSFVLGGGTYVPTSVLHGFLNDIDPSADGEAAPPTRAIEPIETKAISGPRTEESDKTAEPPTPFISVQLTDRQNDVLSGLSSGRSNKEIARHLNMSEATVKVHVRQIMKKLGVSNRTQVALMVSSQRPLALNS